MLDDRDAPIDRWIRRVTGDETIVELSESARQTADELFERWLDAPDDNGIHPLATNRDAVLHYLKQYLPV